MKKSTKFFIGMTSALVIGLGGFGVGLLTAPDSKTAQSVTEGDKSYIEELENKLTDLQEDYNLTNEKNQQLENELADLQEDFDNVSINMENAILTKIDTWNALNIGGGLLREWGAVGYYPDVEGIKSGINNEIEFYQNASNYYNNDPGMPIAYETYDEYSLQMTVTDFPQMIGGSILRESIQLPQYVKLSLRITVNGDEVSQEEYESYLTANMSYYTKAVIEKNEAGEVTGVVWEINIFTVEDVI